MQFYIRLLLCRGLYEIHVASLAQGLAALSGCLRAAATAVEAMHKADKLDDAADRLSLVYNCSVLHWFAVRPLFRAGAHRFAVPSLAKVVEQLLASRSATEESSGEADVHWIARNVLALSWAQHSSGDSAGASASLETASSLAGAASSSLSAALRAEVLSTHMAVVHTKPTVDATTLGDVSPSARVTAEEHLDMLHSLQGMQHECHAAAAKPPIPGAAEPGSNTPKGKKKPTSPPSAGSLVGGGMRSAAAAEGQLVGMLMRADPMAAQQYMARSDPAAAQHFMDTAVAESQAAVRAAHAEALAPSGTPSSKGDSGKRGKASASSTAPSSPTPAQAAAEREVAEEGIAAVRRVGPLPLLTHIAYTAALCGLFDLAAVLLQRLTQGTALPPPLRVLADITESVVLAQHMTPGIALDAQQRLQASAVPAATAEAVAIMGRASNLHTTKASRASFTDADEHFKQGAVVPLDATGADGEAARGLLSVPFQKRLPSSLSGKAFIVRQSDAVSAAERAVQTAQRSGSGALLEMAAVHAFNTCMPLLKRGHGSVVLRCLSACATALTSCASGLVALRARCHALLAHLELQTGQLSRAAEHAASVLALDYADVESILDSVSTNRQNGVGTGDTTGLFARSGAEPILPGALTVHGLQGAGELAAATASQPSPSAPSTTRSGASKAQQGKQPVAPASAAQATAEALQQLALAAASGTFPNEYPGSDALQAVADAIHGSKAPKAASSGKAKKAPETESKGDGQAEEAAPPSARSVPLSTRRASGAEPAGGDGKDDDSKSTGGMESDTGGAAAAQVSGTELGALSPASNNALSQLLGVHRAMGRISGSQEHSQGEAALDRTLDRFVLPLSKEVQLATAVYDEPDGEFERASVALLQAVAAASPNGAIPELHKAVVHLGKCAAALLNAPGSAALALLCGAAVDDATDGKQEEKVSAAAVTQELSVALFDSSTLPDGAAGGVPLRRLHLAWARVAELSSKHGALDLARRACRVLMGVRWNVDTHGDMALHQATSCLHSMDATAQLFPHVHAVGSDACILRGTAGASSSLTSTAAAHALRRQGGSTGLHASVLRVSPIAVVGEVNAERSRRRLGVSHTGASRPGTSMEPAAVQTAGASMLQDQCFDGIGRLRVAAAEDVMRGVSTLGPAPDAAVWRAQAIARSVLPGFEVPGTSDAVNACKRALSTACVNACRLATALGRGDIVGNACAKLWNAHRHVWSGSSPERTVATHSTHKSHNELEGDSVFLAAAVGLGDPRYGSSYAAGCHMASHLRQALAVSCAALMATGCQDTKLLCCLSEAAGGACEAAAAAAAAAGHGAQVREELQRGIQLATAPFRRLAASAVWRGSPSQRVDGGYVGVLDASTGSSHPADLPVDLRMPGQGAYSATTGFLPTPFPRPTVALPLLQLSVRLRMRLSLLEAPGSVLPLEQLLADAVPLTVASSSQLAFPGATDSHIDTALCDGGSPQLLLLSAALVVLSAATGSTSAAFVDCATGPGACLAQASGGCVLSAKALHTAHSTSVPGGLPLVFGVGAKRDALALAISAVGPAFRELGLSLTADRLDTMGLPPAASVDDAGNASASGKKSAAATPKKSARDSARSKGSSGKAAGGTNEEACVPALAGALESLAMAALDAKVPGSDTAALQALFAAGQASTSSKGSRASSFKGPSREEGQHAINSLSEGALIVRRALAVRLRMSASSMPAAVVAQADSPDAVLPQADYAKVLAWACSWTDESIALLAQMWARIAQSACDMWSLQAAQRASAAALCLVPAEPARQQQLGATTRGHAYRWFAIASIAWGKSIAAMVSHRAAVAAVTAVLHEAEERGELQLGGGSTASTPRGKGKKGGASKGVDAHRTVSKVEATSLARSTEDSLRLLALSKLSMGLHWAAAARSPHPAVSAAVQALSVAAPLMGNPVTRSALQPHLKHLTASLCRVFAAPGAPISSSSSAGTLRPLVMDAAAAGVAGDLFRALLVCHADVADWSGGLQVAEDAFALLPSSQHSKLWPSRVVFQARLGHDVAHGLQQLRVQLQKQQQQGAAGKSDPALLGRLWLSLARASSDPGDQLSALSASLEVTEGMFARVYGCFALAEWCTRQRLPASDTRDALHGAADILLEVVQPSAGKSRDLAAVDAGDDGESSVWGGSTVMSRSMVSRGAPSGAGTSQGSSGNRSARSGVQPPPSRQSNRTGSDVVSVVGADDANVSANGDWPSQPTVQHVDMLVRAFTQLAAVAPSAGQRRQYSLRATYFVQMAWGMATAASNRVAAETAFARLPREQQAVVQDSAGGYDWWVEERVAAGQPYAVPNDSAGWSSLVAAVASHPWWGSLPASSFVPPAPADDADSKSTDDAVLPDQHGAFSVPHPGVSQGEGWVFFVPVELVPEAMFASAHGDSAGNTAGDGQSSLRSSAPATSAMRSTIPPTEMPGRSGHADAGAALLECCESTRQAAHHAALLSTWRAPESSQQPFMLCRDALDKPALSLSTLVQLAQMLVADGEYPAAAPVLLLALHAADSLVGHRMNSSFQDIASVSALLRVLQLQWCDAMDMHLPAALLRRALGLDSGRHGSNDDRGAGQLDLSLTPAAITALAVLAAPPNASEAAGRSTTSTPRTAASQTQSTAGDVHSLRLPGVNVLQLHHTTAATSEQLLSARVAAAAVLSSCAPLASGGVGHGPPKEEVTAFEGEVSLWEEAQRRGGLSASKGSASIADEIMGVAAVQVRAVSSTSAELDIHQVWLDLALAAAGAGSLEGAVKWLEPAERHARAFKDPDMLARSHLLRASILFHRGSALEAAEAASQATAGFAFYINAPQSPMEGMSEELIPASQMPGAGEAAKAAGVQLSALGSAPIGLWEAASVMLADTLAWGSHKGDALLLLLVTAEAAERAGRPHVLDMPQVLDTVQQAARSRAKAAKNLASMVAVGSAAGIALATKAARASAAQAAAKEAADTQARAQAPPMYLLPGPLAKMGSMTQDAVALVSGRLDARHAAGTLLRSAAETLQKHSKGDSAASEAVQSEMEGRLQRAVEQCRKVAPTPRAPPSHRHRHAPIPSALGALDASKAHSPSGISGGHIALPAMEAAVRLHTATGVALTSTALSVRQADSDAWREDWVQAALHFMRAIALGHSLGLRAPLVAACTAFAQALVAVPGGEPTWWDDLQLPNTPVSQAQLATAQSAVRGLQASPRRPLSSKWTAALHSPTAPGHSVQSTALAQLLLAHQQLRAQALGDALHILRFAFEEVCQPWGRACPSAGMGSTAPHVGPAQRATSAVQCMLVDTLVLCSFAEARPVMLGERVLLHAVQHDPVAMYLHSQGGSPEEIAHAESKAALQESKEDSQLLLPQSSIQAGLLQEAIVHGHALLAASDTDGGLRGPALLRLGIASAAAANNHTAAALQTSSAVSAESTAAARDLPELTAPPSSVGSAVNSGITLADVIWWPRQAAAVAPVRVYLTPSAEPDEAAVVSAKSRKSPRATKGRDSSATDEPAVLEIDACMGTTDVELLQPPGWLDPLAQVTDALAIAAPIPDGRTKVQQRSKTPPKGAARASSAAGSEHDVEVSEVAARAAKGGAAVLLDAMRRLGVPWADQLEVLLHSAPGSTLTRASTEAVLVRLQQHAEDAEAGSQQAAAAAAASRPSSGKASKAGGNKSGKSPRAAVHDSEGAHKEDQYRLAAHRVPLAVDVAGAAELAPCLTESMQVMHPDTVASMQCACMSELQAAVATALGDAKTAAAGAAGLEDGDDADGGPAGTTLSTLPKQALQDAASTVLRAALGLTHPFATISIPRPLIEHHAKALAALHAAVAVGTAASDWSTVGEAAYQLSELYGTTAPSRAAASLALHQSVRVRSRLLQLLVEAGRDADVKTAELARGNTSDDIIGGGEGAGELVLMLRSVLSAEAAHHKGLLDGGHLASVGGLHGNLGAGFVHSSGGFGPASASSVAISGSAASVDGAFGAAAGSGVSGTAANIGSMLLHSAASSSPLSHPQHRRIVAELSRICLAYQLMDCSRPWHGCLAALPAGHRLCVLQLSPAADALLLTVTWRLPAGHVRPSAAHQGPTGACDMHVSSAAARIALSPEAVAALVCVLRDMQEYRRSSEVALAELEGCNPGQGGAWLDYDVVTSGSSAVPAIQQGRFTVDTSPGHPLAANQDVSSCAVHACTGDALAVDQAASVDLAVQGAGLPSQGCLAMCAPAAAERGTHAMGSDKPSQQFDHLLARVEAILRPLFSPAVTASVAGPAPLVLCVDPALEALPFEALQHFQAATSVTREFSVQFLGNRAAAAATALHPDALKPPVSHLPAPLSSMSLLAKTSSVASMARGLSDSIPISQRNCVYIVDPLADDHVPGDWAGEEDRPVSRPESAASDTKSGRKGSTKRSPSPSKGKTGAQEAPTHTAPPPHLLTHPLPTGLGRHGTTAQFNALVKPVLAQPRGKDARQPAPSSQQWLGLLTRGKLIDSTDAAATEAGTDVGGDGGDASEGSRARSMLVYTGPTPLLQVLQPELLVGLDARLTGLAVLACGVSTDAAFRRAARLRNVQSAARQGLTSPYATAALLSLTGVGAVALNSWGSTVGSNITMLRQLLETVEVQPVPSVDEADNQTVHNVVHSEYVSVSRAIRKSLHTPLTLPGSDHLVLPKARVRASVTVYGLPTVHLISK